MSKYNNLTIVSYNAGYGGDFFCSLLSENYKPTLNDTFRDTTDPFNNHYLFPMYLEQYKCLTNVLKLSGAMIDGSVYDNDYLVLYSYLKKACMDVYDDDPNKIISNIISRCRDLYEQNRPDVWSCHYLRVPALFKSFTMDRMFPESKKILLVSDKKYHMLFECLEVFKRNICVVNKQTLQRQFKTVPGSRSSRVVLDHIFDIENSVVKLEDFIPVDVGELFIGGNVNIKIISQQISDITNRAIELNEGAINTYREKNNNILRHMIESDVNYDDVVGNSIRLKNYFIKNERCYVG